MNVLIFEDETLASERIKKILLEIDKTINVLAEIKSVEEGKRWLEANDAPDLIISDIRLLDGLSFEIFKEQEVETPIIFTTAYDQYAIRAFEVNSVDYLLKPVQKEKLAASIRKHATRKKEDLPPADFDKLYELIRDQKKSFKSRFLIKIGQKIVAVPVEKISYFYSQNKLTYIVTKEGKKLPADQTLEQLEDQLDPKSFYRANRQFIISYESISEIHPYFKGRMKIELDPASDLDIVISADKTPEFKSWLDQ